MGAEEGSIPVPHDDRIRCPLNSFEALAERS